MFKRSSVFNEEQHMQIDRAKEVGPISGLHSIEKRTSLPKKKEKPSIDLDIENIQEGDSFQGSTGEYTFVQPPNPDIGFLESIVRDPEGKEFFLHTKESERQALASLIGQWIMKKYPEFASFRFPEIRLEKLNGKNVAFMEYFRNHEEVTDKNDLTVDEKAFLTILNLWMGNWDFKKEHILASKQQPHEFGLIDLEKSFDFDDRERLSKTAERPSFLGEISVDECMKYIESIGEFDEADKDILLQQAADTGIDPREAQSVIDTLTRRKNVLLDELETVCKIHEQQRLIEERELKDAA